MKKIAEFQSELFKFSKPVDLNPGQSLTLEQVKELLSDEEIQKLKEYLYGIVVHAGLDQKNLLEFDIRACSYSSIVAIVLAYKE